MMILRIERTKDGAISIHFNGQKMNLDSIPPGAAYVFKIGARVESEYRDNSSE